MSDDQWQRNGCSDRIGTLFAEIFGLHRRAAVVTKLMHLKRPNLIPICDSLVAGNDGQQG